MPPLCLLVFLSALYLPPLSESKTTCVCYVYVYVHVSVCLSLYIYVCVFTVLSCAWRRTHLKCKVQ